MYKLCLMCRLKRPWKFTTIAVKFLFLINYQTHKIIYSQNLFCQELLLRLKISKSSLKRMNLGHIVVSADNFITGLWPMWETTLSPNISPTVSSIHVQIAVSMSILKWPLIGMLHAVKLLIIQCEINNLKIFSFHTFLLLRKVLYWRIVRNCFCSRRFQKVHWKGWKWATLWNMLPVFKQIRHKCEEPYWI